MAEPGAYQRDLWYQEQDVVYRQDHDQYANNLVLIRSFERLKAHAPHQDQREPENDLQYLDVEAASVQCWKITSKLCDEGFLNDVRYRIAVVDLHVRFVEATEV